MVLIKLVINYDKSTNTLSRNQKIQSKNQEHFFGYAWIIIDNYKHSRIDKQTLFNSSLSIDVWIASSKMKPICNAILTTLYLCTYKKDKDIKPDTAYASYDWA